MLILIKGPAGSGTGELADRIVSRLDLPPVTWPLDPAALAEAQGWVGEWIDLAAYFRQCRHVDLDRVLTLLQLDNLQRWPPPPCWRPGTPPDAMFAWRGSVFRELGTRPFLPALFERTCGVVDSLEHAVVEGKSLGGSRQDSLLTNLLRQRYAARPMLRVLLQRPSPPDPDRALVNGHWLEHDELLGALSRRPDGGVEVDPWLGLSWSGETAAGQALPEAASAAAAGERAEERP
jgi:hypothetical protein